MLKNQSGFSIPVTLLAVMLLLITASFGAWRVVANREHKKNKASIQPVGEWHSQRFSDDGLQLSLPPGADLSTVRTLKDGTASADLPNDYHINIYEHKPTTSQYGNFDYQEKHHQVASFTKKDRTYYVLANRYDRRSTDSLFLSTCSDTICLLPSKKGNNIGFYVEISRTIPKEDYRCCSNPSQDFRIDDPYVDTLISVFKSIEY